MTNHDQQFIAQKIRTQYMEQQPGALDALRALDAQVKRPVQIFAYIFGSLSALLMGAGMSLVMTDIAAQLGIPLLLLQGNVIGIGAGLVGMALAIANYPIYKRWLRARRAYFAPQILELSEALIH